MILKKKTDLSCSFPVPDPDFISFQIPDQGVKKHRIWEPDPVGSKKADPTDQDPEHLSSPGLLTQIHCKQIRNQNPKHYDFSPSYGVQDLDPYKINHL
jgi:hypothetical protein